MRSERVAIGAPAPQPRLMEPGLASNLSYMGVLEQQGVERDATGRLIHWMPYGTRQGRNGKMVPVLKAFPVALSVEEAREQTRATGDRHDYYTTGLRCKRCIDPLVGWVLGGRKLQIEHDHVVFDAPDLYREIEDDEQDATADERVAVEV